jgi:hypothetical protein
LLEVLDANEAQHVRLIEHVGYLRERTYAELDRDEARERRPRRRFDTGQGESRDDERRGDR